MIDIGLNLTSSQFVGEQPELVARARAAGVEALILTGTDLDGQPRERRVGRPLAGLLLLHRRGASSRCQECR